MKSIDHLSALKMAQAITPQSTEIYIEDVIQRIIKLNEGLQKFWEDSEGWAPPEAAWLLEKSRLDWQVSLSNCLKIWISKPSKKESDGFLILGWANLGSLVEGTMKLFLSVWYEVYKDDQDLIIMRRGQLQDPDVLKLEAMRQYFKKKIWDDTWDTWVLRIQRRRNAIHAFKERDIGTHSDLLDEIRKYLEFLRYMNARLPYPDEMHGPLEV